MYKRLYFLIVLVIFSYYSFGQDRITEIENTLEQYADSTIPGLNERIDFSVTGLMIQEFLRGVAESADLNISVDPQLDIRIYNNFTDEQVKNILVFLCKQYDLQITFTGTIMYFSKYRPPVIPPAIVQPKPINVDYNRGSNLLSFDLRYDSIFEVVKKINTISDQNVVLSPKIPSNSKVSIFLQNSPFEQAIDKLAYANGFRMTKSEDGFYIIEPAEQDEIVETSSRTSRRNLRNTRGSRNTRGNSDAEFEFELKDSLNQTYLSISAINAPIAEILSAIGDEAQIDYLFFSEPSGNTSLFVNDITYDQLLGFILNGSEHTYIYQDGVYLIGQRQTEVLRTTKTIQLKYRALTDVLKLIPAEIKKGVEIQEFSELNSFILSGSTLQINEIEQFISSIDQVVPMVMIEVIMVDVIRGRSISTGIRAGRGDVDSSRFELLPGIDILLNSKSVNRLIAPLNIGNVKSDFYVQLSMLENQNIIDMRSVPKLSTLNGHEATYAIGETEYYEIQTVTAIGSQNPSFQTTNQYQSVEANTSIRIMPLVSGDDQVTLEIDVEVSDFKGIPTGNQPPPTSTSSFSSMIRVRNDEMVMLGGMERTSRSENSSGLPFLSRIPIIKWFFSSRSRSKSKTIQVVFIRPTIIH